MGKWLTAGLWICLLFLQHRLWLEKHSIPDYWLQQRDVQAQVLQNAKLQQRNSLLRADVQDLKIGLEAIEERARHELGLIKPGETFYRILPADN